VNLQTSRLLIVDDDPALLAGLSDALHVRLPEVSTATAASAKQALGLMANADFDCILCDLVMPEMNGLEFLRRVRQVCPETAVILMTGCGNDATAAEARRLGAAGFLPKPFTMDDVVPLIRCTLERTPLLRRLHETNRRSVLGHNTGSR